MAVTLSISITQNSRNISANTSNVTVKVNASWTYGSWNHLNPAGWVKIDGKTYNFNANLNPNKTTTGSGTLYTKTVNIAHNSDGSKTLACSASYATGGNSDTVTASVNKVLTAIPRATTPTVSSTSVALESAVTIKTPRASTNFSHKLRYTCGSASADITSGGFDSYNWTVPKSLASQIPSGTSKTVTITCITYNGSTNLGSKTCTFTVTVPTTTAYQPAISSISTSDPTGYLSKYGAYVQGKSTVAVTTNATAGYGSSIKKYSSSGTGKTYSTKTYTSNTLSKSGTVTISSTVTDNRNRTASKTASITVAAYSAPKINTFSISRCNADNSANDEGSYAAITYGLSITNINNSNKNSKTATIKYKPVGSDDSAIQTISITPSAYSVAATTLPAVGVNAELSYEFTMSVTDDFGTTVATKVLSTAETLLDFHNSGSGMAIGKVAEEGGILDIGYPTRFRQDLDGQITKSSPCYWIDGRDNAIIRVPTHNGANSFHPIISNKTPTGEWTLGIQNENFHFAYSTDENYNTDTNEVKNYYINSDGLFSGTAAAVKFPMVIPNSGTINSLTTDGVTLNLLHLNGSNNIVIGSGGYDQRIGQTNIYGNKIHFYTRSSIGSNRSLKVLWSGGHLMNANQTATLSEAVSEQLTGIVLHWQAYSSGAVQNYHHSYTFVPKSHTNGGGISIFLTDSYGNIVGTKYVYVGNTTVTGNDVNDDAKADRSGGIASTSNYWVMTEVLGV